MKNISLTHSLTAISLLVAVSHSEAKTKLPNVILIMADDLGWGDVGFNGNTKIKTPHLDKMASEGAVLDRFYSASAVSSPTRFSVLTGRNPHRSGIFNANVGILREEEITIAELLNQRGYVAGHFGKWHLGSLTHTQKDANRGKVGNTKDYNPPKLHGFQQAFVTESKVPTWDAMLTPIAGSIGESEDADKSARKAYGTAYWDINSNEVKDNLMGDDSRVIMDRVLPFIEENKNNPFLAVVWFHAPHKPYVAGPEYAAMYEGESVDYKNYAGCITALDEQVGRLRDYLKELGVDKNTMVWFCSDNGPERGTPGPTGGHLERKRSLHEGGVRVPACVVWPSQIKPSTKISAPLWTCDYLPTIATAAGVDKSKMSYELDGIDIMPMIIGKQDKRNSPFVHIYNKAVSLQDDDYKYYANNTDTLSYNIAADRYEKNPVRSHQRTTEAQAIVERVLKSYMSSFMGEEYGTKSFDRMKQNPSSFGLKGSK